MTIKIIAEVAQGYEGDPNTAYMLAKAGVKSGADAVKFQCIFADELAVPDYKFYDLFKTLEMPDKVWEKVAQIVKEEKLEFYFDIFGKQSFGLAKQLNADGVKIHATDFFNSELIISALATFPKVFISTGGISIEELKEFFNRYKIPEKCEVCLMYGYQAEPTPIENNNLNRLKELKNYFPDKLFGFMDHADGKSSEKMTLSLLSIPLEVQYIEKHISLDPLLELEDFISALTPTEFKGFVDMIRYHEKAMGLNDLALTDSEQDYRGKVLKVAVAAKDLKNNHVITNDVIELKRPDIYSDNCYLKKEDIKGKVLNRDIAQNEVITKEKIN